MRCFTPLILLGFLAGIAGADDKINWSATDITGAQVSAPASDRSTVMVFIRPGQSQSDSALEQIKSVVTEHDAVVIVISGDLANEEAKAFASAGKYSWPVVADPDFKSSGDLNVHVWPTTVVIARSGAQAAHLPGTNDTFASDLRAYLEHASGSIDQAALEKRLDSHAVATESSTQMADTYLQVARRLIDSGELDQARSQVEQGLKLHPDDIELKLVLARVQILQGSPADALKLLDALPSASIPPAKLAVLRGRALIGLEKWDDAKTALESTVGLNPDPAESQYLLGLIYQHANDWPHAAESFRKAYESRERKRS